MKVKGNINDSVWVKLTEDGKRIHNEHYASNLKHSKAPVNLKDYKPKVSGKGYTEYQLWQIAHIFGPVLYNGSQISPFKENCIYYTNPEAIM